MGKIDTLSPGDDILLHSMVHKHFTKEVLFELDKLCMNHSVDNNTKGVVINQILTAFNIPFKGLGSGTNRYTVLIEDYVFKIALDEDGKTDNKREFIYSKDAQPYVIRFYECMANGLLGVCEYFEVFSEEDFYSTKNQIEMKKILKELTKVFLVGDVGIYKKNYTNWGYRQSDRSIGILDFAYIYKLSYRAFQCTCPDKGMLYYDNDYNQLICSICGKKHTFWDIRKRIPREVEKAEIGDIRTRGYLVQSEWSHRPADPKFTDIKVKKKKEDKNTEKPKDILFSYKTMSEDDQYLTEEELLRRLSESIKAENEQKGKKDHGKKEKDKIQTSE